jgi:hypothetical protein
MKTLGECKAILNEFTGGPAVLTAGRDAVAHAEALLGAARTLNSMLEKGANTLTHSDLDAIRKARMTIAKSEAVWS